MLFKNYFNRIIANEISTFSKYYDHVVQTELTQHDDKKIFENIQCESKKIVPVIDSEQVFTKSNRVLVLLNGSLNYSIDIFGYLKKLKNNLNRQSRIAVVLYNPYFAWIYKFANWIGLRKAPIPKNFITLNDLKNLTTISQYNIVKLKNLCFFPFSLFGLGGILNAILSVIPGLKNLSYVTLVVLRPKVPSVQPSLSIVVPARNEFGNIESAITTLPSFGDAQIEIIYVEGHSTDATWDEILRVQNKYQNKFKIKAFQQKGTGKVDAVRLGFSEATSDLITILDADLTTPPETLKNFYDIYCSGDGDFVNGNRLLYQQEKNAMRFLNRLGNIFFAKFLRYILDVPIGDSLCGTKLLSRSDYDRFIKWRCDFGDFDPFGDFELIFPASVLCLGCIDYPIHYKARIYGETNILRFRHGLMLLKMSMIGLFKIKLRIS